MRERERETAATFPFHPMSTYTRVTHPRTQPHSHSICRTPAIRQKADHRSRFTSRYILFEVSTVLSGTYTFTPPVCPALPAPTFSSF